ncbi:MAG TPA: class I tRNA ligase family protein, partial [Acidimicrobiia bacterium]|nr:class I tRNA ligase family protein [Acidimicrobiia bacterium]
EAVLGEGAEIVGHLTAAELVGLHYERPFSFVPIPPDANRVVAADFVTTDDGSGIVHLAPAFGEVDREVGDAEGLPALNPVDVAGRFEAVVEPWAGLFVKEADPGIIDALRAAGRLEKVEAYEHSYPHCWRCGTPLIYYAKTSWFARTQAEKAALIEQNETIAWHPEHIKHGRFGDWLENNIDWALSRDRYWGTPLPVWRCAAEGAHDTCVGSVAELGRLAGRDLSDLDLHRPYVDDVTFPCPVEGCGATATRLEPVLDAWFDSGSMPAAQFHHPFAGDGTFEHRFPADFICEAIDQTRGWFYSLLAVNTLVFGRSPYRNVVCLAHVVDQDGAKMSKSKGNVLDPWEIFRTKGADPLRWYFFSAGSPWTNRRVYGEGIDESIRKFLLTLWNTLSFFVTYANLEGWEPVDHQPEHVLDKWLASRREATVNAVTEALEDYDTLLAAQTLESFVDDLSNWYVRRSRPRFWKASDPGAFAALHQSLSTVALLLAPFCPFVADEIHGVLSAGSGEVSVHLCDWPEADQSAIDAGLETEMALARKLVALGRAARGEARMKVRQPLRRALLLVPGAGRLSGPVAAQVSEELNVKALEVVESLAGLIRYSVVPNFRAL